MAPFLVWGTRGGDKGDRGQGDGSPVLLIKLFYLKRQENRPLVPMSRCKYAMPTYSERFAFLVVAAFAVCLQKKTFQDECKHPSGMSFFTSAWLIATRKLSL